MHKFGKQIARMRRIEGQARGIAKMMEEDRYCIDILQQFAAIEAALRSTRAEVLKIHAGHCVEEAIASGDKHDQKQKFSELVSLFEKQGR
ncbi:transcriptional regulator [Tardibacter chloracetimidivorans]|uniref:Transcriptional regulator n=2 Tax=Tardibacter chloracetimidivorans TaxID=1921510 RepID=A0A1L3ZXY1_9SPHN|nr:metal-sensitive transcriptional regulator [Tardibacter chloracetimidivorans]API60488.1 transcriptional regulator [Tardibacter chloracetimidivorans]